MYQVIPGGGNGNPFQYSCWRTPWAGEPGRLQSMVSQRVRHNLATTHILFQKKCRKLKRHFFHYLDAIFFSSIKNTRIVNGILRFKIKVQQSVNLYISTKTRKKIIEKLFHTLEQQNIKQLGTFLSIKMNTFNKSLYNSLDSLGGSDGK